MVYVVSKNGKQLMPTNNAKARILLKNKFAKCINVKPFIIKLNYSTTEYIQEKLLNQINFKNKEQENTDMNYQTQLTMEKELKEEILYKVIRNDLDDFTSKKENDQINLCFTKDELTFVVKCMEEHFDVVKKIEEYFNNKEKQ